MPTRKAQRGILTSHVREAPSWRPFLISAFGHAAVVLAVLALGYLLPRSIPIQIGAGPGGGSGEDFIPVRLAEASELGGLGTVKPMLTPQPAAAPPPKTQIEKPKPEPTPQKEEVFLEKPKEVEKPPARDARRQPPPPKPPEPKPGDIERPPDPGPGGRGRPVPGAGTGFGPSVGQEVGSGTGQEGAIDSAYVRIVEQRVGQNWLATSLGTLPRQVRTVISFTVARGGAIGDIRLVESSGSRTVDLAAERAVVASNPLPPLPLEFRGHSVRFRAEFEYPPKPAR